MVEDFVHVHSVVFPHVGGKPSECTFKKTVKKSRAKGNEDVLLMKPTRRTMFGLLIILEIVRKSRRLMTKFPGSCSIINTAGLAALKVRQTHRSAIAKRYPNVVTLERPSAVEAFGAMLFPGKIFALLAKAAMSGRLRLGKSIINSLHNSWPIRIIHRPSSHHHEETAVRVLQPFWFSIQQSVSSESKHIKGHRNSQPIPRKNRKPLLQHLLQCVNRRA